MPAAAIAANTLAAAATRVQLRIVIVVLLGLRGLHFQENRMALEAGMKTSLRRP
jgi:hypothetical protein